MEATVVNPAAYLHAYCPPDTVQKLRVTVGPPGCGKTTEVGRLATEAAKTFGSHYVLIASLTRAAAAEVTRRRLPLPTDRVGTLHSHAFRALGAPEIVTRKHLAEINERLKQGFSTAGMERDVDGEDSTEETTMKLGGDVLLEKYCVLRATMTDRASWPVEVLDFARAWESWKEERGVMDFEDLIERAREDVAQAPGHPAAIYLDEAQDHSQSELALALSWARAATGLVLVGDPDQALYGWRGAAPDTLLALVPPEHRHVLSQSYRVPACVHHAAVSWIRGMPGWVPVEYRPRDAEGEARVATYSLMMPRRVIEEAVGYADAGKTVMILASCSYMLEPVKNELRAQGVPFHNPYRLHNGGWNPLRAAERLLNYLRPDPATWGGEARGWTWKEAWSWLQCVDAKKMEPGAKREVETLAKGEDTGWVPVGVDVEDAIEGVGQCFPAGTKWWEGGKAEALRALILGSKKDLLEYPMRVAERFGGKRLRDEPRIVLGTIHSVKGAEADVVILFPDLSPKAQTAWDQGDKAPTYRLLYVGMTRARESLVLGQPTNWRYPQEFHRVVVNKS